jgi:hypothetical protein
VLADALDARDHRSRIRRLTESLFSGALAAPYAMRETATNWGTYGAAEQSMFEASVRYVVYGERKPAQTTDSSYSSQHTGQRWRNEFNTACRVFCAQTRCWCAPIPCLLYTRDNADA